MPALESIFSRGNSLQTNLYLGGPCFSDKKGREEDTRDFRPDMALLIDCERCKEHKMIS